MFGDLSEESKRELEARQARDLIEPECQEQADGTWVAKKLGCVGIGETKALAIFDLGSKVEIVHGPAWMRDEKVRDGMAELRPSLERILRKLQ